MDLHFSVFDVVHVALGCHVGIRNLFAGLCVRHAFVVLVQVSCVLLIVVAVFQWRPCVCFRLWLMQLFVLLLVL